MLKKKRILITISMMIAVTLAAYFILNNQHNIMVPSWPLEHLTYLQNFYSQFPIRSVLIFGLLHLLSSGLSIPGSCTVLNIASGAVFGFARGCLIVYAVTILSACVGYVVGGLLPLSGIRKKYSKQIELIRENMAAYDYVSMVMVRLSPFLPFGVLNLAFGFLRIPFWVYITSTTVGVFFDVVLLNSVGALVSGQQASGWQNKEKLLLTFVSLFIATYFLKIFKTKWTLMNSRVKRDELK